MEKPVVVSGRVFPGVVLERVRSEIVQHPELSRQAIARRVCEWMNWRGPNGRLKQMSCRMALLKLHRRGLICLPGARGGNGTEHAEPPDPWPKGAPITGSVQDVAQLRLVAVSSADAELNEVWNRMMATYHPRGKGPLVGAQQRYLIGSGERWLGGLAFSASAWQLAPRDRWIGWSNEARRANLHYVVSNSRFLILPTIAS